MQGLLLGHEIREALQHVQGPPTPQANGHDKEAKKYLDPYGRNSVVNQTVVETTCAHIVCLKNLLALNK